MTSLPCLEKQPMAAKQSLTTNNFGQWFKEMRVSRGLTMEDVADRADSAQPVISNLERGARNPSRDMVERLTRALSNDDMSETSIKRFVDQGLIAAGFQPQSADSQIDIERLRDAEMLAEAGYSELTDRDKQIVLDLIASVRRQKQEGKE